MTSMDKPDGKKPLKINKTQETTPEKDRDKEKDKFSPGEPDDYNADEFATD